MDFAVLERKQIAIEDAKTLEDNEKLLPAAITKEYFEMLSVTTQVNILMDLSLLSEDMENSLIEVIIT